MASAAPESIFVVPDPVIVPAVHVESALENVRMPVPASMPPSIVSLPWVSSLLAV